MSTPLDCRACGACCCNPTENRREAYAAYVAIADDDRLRQRGELLRRFATADQTHLRLDPDGRCLALRGAVGRRVRCAIYHYRPSPCRQVEADSELCHRYRRDRGVTPT